MRPEERPGEPRGPTRRLSCGRSRTHPRPFSWVAPNRPSGLVLRRSDDDTTYVVEELKTSIKDEESRGSDPEGTSGLLSRSHPPVDDRPTATPVRTPLVRVPPWDGSSV